MALTKDEARKVKGFLKEAFQEVSAGGLTPPAGKLYGDFAIGLGGDAGGYAVSVTSETALPEAQKELMKRLASESLGRSIAQSELKFTVAGPSRPL